MRKTSTSELWAPALIILGFPVLYMLYGYSEFATGFFVEKNPDYYFLFWGGIVALHWASVLCVAVNLRFRKLRFADIGFKLSKRGVFLLSCSYLAVAFAVLAITELVLSQMTLDIAALERLPGLIPRSTPQRLFFIALVFSTGLCEEIVYRGFAISSMARLGLNKWLALPIAAFIFVGIHGFNAYSGRFLFLFGGGIMFGVLYLVSNRLLPSIVLHLAINLSAMMAVLGAES